VADGSQPAVGEALSAALAHPDPLVRGHAVWAAARLGRSDLLARLEDEEDPGVRAELDRVAAGAVTPRAPGATTPRAPGATTPR
jgi:hypothetical protein